MTDEMWGEGQSSAEHPSWLQQVPGVGASRAVMSTKCAPAHVAVRPLESVAS